MSAGHGRGYYGSSQLEKPRSGSGWFKFAVVVGLGAALWFLWQPSSGDSKPKEEPALPPAPTPPPPGEEFEQLARSRGFSSAKTYEDSVVANARELQAAGAKVVLAPHLQHLESRLES